MAIAAYLAKNEMKKLHKEGIFLPQVYHIMSFSVNFLPLSRNSYIMNLEHVAKVLCQRQLKCHSTKNNTSGLCYFLDIWFLHKQSKYNLIRSSLMYILKSYIWVGHYNPKKLTKRPMMKNLMIIRGITLFIYLSLIHI